MPGEILRRDAGHIAIRLSGSPYERGVAHGTLLRDEIDVLRNALPAFISKAVSSVVSIDPDEKIVKTISRIVEWYLRRASQKFYPFFPQWAKKEVEGIAAGSGQKKTTILLINTFDEILITDCLIRIAERVATIFSCSAIAARGNQGAFVYGFNLDYFISAEEIAKLTTVFLNETQRVKFISFGLPGSIGVLRGMNSKALVIGYLTSPARPQKAKGAPTALIMRDILERCSTPNEAVQHLKCNLPIQGINILLGNAEQAIVAECIYKKLRVIKPSSDGLPEVLAATNHFRTDLAKFQRRIKIPSFLPRELMDEEFSRKRLDRIERLLQENFVSDINDIQRVLGNANVCHGYTVLSCLFDPFSLTAVLLDNEGRTPASQGRQYPYTFEDFI